jgi:hypothetical protein
MNYWLAFAPGAQAARLVSEDLALVAGVQWRQASSDGGDNVNKCLVRATINLARADCVDDGTDQLLLMVGWTAPSASDDPRIVNIKGQKYDVPFVGAATLLHVPRGAETSQAALVVLGDIQPISKVRPLSGPKAKNLKQSCPKTYVRHLMVMGSLLGNLSSLSFQARDGSTPFMMRMGEGMLVTDGQFTSEVIEANLKKFGNPADVSITVTHQRGLPKGSPEAVNLKVGKAVLTIKRPEMRKGKHFEWMNLGVNGLRTLNYDMNDIGGLLGSDEYTGKEEKHLFYDCPEPKPKKHSAVLNGKVPLASTADGTMLAVGIVSD